jgi:uncharacterized protein (DUF1684 family)
MLVRSTAVLAAIALTSCASKPAPLDPAYVSELQKWRGDREARLKADDGWLTLVGLYWIEPGISKVGSDPTANVPLPAKLPKQVGTIDLKDNVATFTPAAGVPLKRTTLHDDQQKDYETLKLDSVNFYLIHRGDRYGIRIKDAQSPARTNFAGLDWYPPDPTWNVDATFTPSPHKVTFDTQVGVKEEEESPGYFEFDRDGQHIKLEAVKEDDELFFVIRDATSGKTTYAASRFIYTPLPKNGHVKIDFNKAYNPPCVFTDFATCPLPTPQNRLKIPIEAGEKIYRSHLPSGTTAP